MNWYPCWFIGRSITWIGTCWTSYWVDANLRTSSTFSSEMKILETKSYLPEALVKKLISYTSFSISFPSMNKKSELLKNILKRYQFFEISCRFQHSTILSASIGSLRKFLYHSFAAVWMLKVETVPKELLPSIASYNLVTLSQASDISRALNKWFWWFC